MQPSKSEKDYVCRHATCHAGLCCHALQSGEGASNGPSFIAVKGAAIVAAILMASMENPPQASPRKWLSQSQQSSLQPRPIIHGFHLQPNRSELQELGVPAPSRQQ